MVHPHLSGQTCFQCLDIEVSQHHGTAVYCMVNHHRSKKLSDPIGLFQTVTPPKLIDTDRPFPSIISHPFPIHFHPEFQHRVPPVFSFNVTLEPPGLGDVTSIERRELSVSGGTWAGSCSMGDVECHNMI